MTTNEEYLLKITTKALRYCAERCWHAEISKYSHRSAMTDSDYQSEVQQIMDDCMRKAMNTEVMPPIAGNS